MNKRLKLNSLLKEYKNTKDITKVIEAIKLRPEIFIGTKSYTRLIFFLKGFEYNYNNLSKSLFDGFELFIKKYYKNEYINSYKAILLYSGFNEYLAFDNFFRIFDVYKKSKYFNNISLECDLKVLDVGSLLRLLKKDYNKHIYVKSFERLMVFIYGYECFLTLNDLKIEEFHFDVITKYLLSKNYFNINMTLNCESIIRYMIDNDEHAFDYFYGIIEQLKLI